MPAVAEVLSVLNPINCVLDQDLNDGGQYVTFQLGRASVRSPWTWCRRLTQWAPTALLCFPPLPLSVPA